jgi:hypothetical protein
MDRNRREEKIPHKPEKKKTNEPQMNPPPSFPHLLARRSLPEFPTTGRSRESTASTQSTTSITSTKSTFVAPTQSVDPRHYLRGLSRRRLCVGGSLRSLLSIVRRQPDDGEVCIRGLFLFASWIPLKRVIQSYRSHLTRRQKKWLT